MKGLPVMDNFLSDRRRRLKLLEAKTNRRTVKRTTAVGDEVTCPACKSEQPREQLLASLYLCPHCGHHLPMPYRERLNQVFDAASARELFAEISTQDPLHFPGYGSKLMGLCAKTGLNDAAVAAVGTIGGYETVCVVLDSAFLMGSMGTAVGEKVTQAAEYAQTRRLPLLIFSASGGARMQEGIYSLMQMAKTAAAIKRFHDDGGLYISYLTHPTTGGVTASFASLGDIMLAEPEALIGFAGPRVIEQTIRAALPEGFQRAQFLLEHGFLDAVVGRREMREMLIQLLRLHERKVLDD